MTPTRKRVAVSISVAALAGCSLTTFDYAPCTSNGACRDAFGFGWVCADDGLCAEVEIEPRCNRVFPIDLFQRIENYRDAIVIGALYDLSADSPENQATQLAVMQVDDYSGLDGQAYALVECTYEVNTVYDNRTQEEATEFATRWLAETLGVPVIVGPATSAMAEAAFYVAEPAGTVLISPSATSPTLSTIDGLTKTDLEPGMFWRTAPPDSLQGQVVAADMFDRGVLDVAVIYQSGPYGEGLAKVFADAFSAGGGTAVLHPFDDDTQRDLAVTTVGADAPSEVLFIASEGSDVAAFLNSAVVLSGYSRMPIFLTDAAHDTDVLTAATSARALFDQVRGTAPSIPAGTIYDFFASAYAGAFPPDTADISVYNAHAWDAGWLAIYGTAWSDANEGAITGLGVARGLRKLSSGTPVDINPTRWSAVRASFNVGSGIDVTGASGSLDFDPYTEETTASIDVWRIGADNASFVTIETVEP